MKLLITGGMSALAQRIGRLVAKDNEVTFGDSIAIPEILIKSGKYLVIPSCQIPSFNHELLKLALDTDIELIVPLIKEEISQLATSKLLFAEYGIKVAVPSLEALKEQAFVLNPTKTAQPLLLLDGRRFQSGEVAIAADDLSGVCLRADAGEGLLFCCLENN